MNIKILDSWLRDYLKTKAKPSEIAKYLSLCSASVERLEKYGDDYLYDIEITTNRPDLMSIIGLAREATAVLPQFGIPAGFAFPKPEIFLKDQNESLPLEIKINNTLVNRICAVILDVKIGKSPDYIRKRLEASGIRSLNNLVDITNYIMRITGHPAHVFDYDRIANHKIIIRESKKGEKIVTLDGKEHTLSGGDIIADNGLPTGQGNGEIIDLLGIMGTANSVVLENTKRIILFIDNNDPVRIRKTSMSNSIRSEAAVLNEKGIDPEIAMDTLLLGIDLYKKTAGAKQLLDIIDIYPNKQKIKKVTISTDKINKVIGIEIPDKTSIDILTKLGFEAKIENKNITVTIPSFRNNDIEIQEDIIEEIARIYGYHRLPDLLPPLTERENYNIENDGFYWERRIKEALKYWGFYEAYTYSMVSEDMLEGPTNDAVTIANPLTEDMVYMRKTLVPSLLKVIRENPKSEEIKIFELSNVYEKKTNNLPVETPILAGAVKKQGVSYSEVKGIIETLMDNTGIKNLKFTPKTSGGEGADIFIVKEYLGEIEILENGLADFELNFKIILKHATLKKNFKPIFKFPPIIEDVRMITDPKISYEEIIQLIKSKSSLVENVELLDIYENKKTFRITYQNPERNLTNEEVAGQREEIYKTLQKVLKAKIT